MEQRTVSEMKAYVDGYNACYERFAEVLLHSTGQPLSKVFQRMMIYRTAVNSVLESEVADGDKS